MSRSSRIIALRRIKKGSTISERGAWARKFNSALDQLRVGPGEPFVLLRPDKLKGEKVTREGRCVYCGEPVLSTQDYQRVEGWVRRRGQGGANQITLRVPRPEWACRGCIDQAKRGTLHQESL